MCFDGIDGAVCGAMDIQNKCDCTFILLDSHDQLLNVEYLPNC